MSELSGYRITEDDVAQHGVIAAPDRLTGTAAQNKAVFDRLLRDAVREKYNAMLTTLEAHLVWDPYDAEQAYVPGNKVVYNGSSYLCTAACTGVLPTNTEHWRLVAARGVDGAGAGDMRADIYDPRRVEADIFAYVDERTDTYNRAETLSDATAQKFVDSNFSESPPATPDEAFALLAQITMIAAIHITAPEGALVTVAWGDNIINTHTATGEPVTVRVARTGTYDITAADTEDSEVIAGATVEITEYTPNADVTLTFDFQGRFTALEYIQNVVMPTGAYINTGIIPEVDNTAIETTLNVQSWIGSGGDGNYAGFFGMDCAAFETADDAKYYYLVGSAYSGLNQMKVDSPVGCEIPFTFGLNTDTLIYAGSKDGTLACRQNGASLGQEAVAREMLSYPFLLLCNSSIDSAGLYARAKMGETKLWYMDELVRDFLPARRKIDSVVGMYDTVEGKFYTSPNDVVFVAGPEKEAS